MPERAAIMSMETLVTETNTGSLWHYADHHLPYLLSDISAPTYHPQSLSLQEVRCPMKEFNFPVSLIGEDNKMNEMLGKLTEDTCPAFFIFILAM